MCHLSCWSRWWYSRPPPGPQWVQELPAPLHPGALSRSSSKAHPKLVLHPTGRRWGRVPCERTPTLSCPDTLGWAQGSTAAGLPQSRSPEQHLPPPLSSPVLTTPARSVFFGYHVCFWGSGRVGALPTPPVPVPVAVVLAPALPQHPGPAVPCR